MTSVELKIVFEADVWLIFLTFEGFSRQKHWSQIQGYILPNYFCLFQNYL